MIYLIMCGDIPQGYVDSVEKGRHWMQRKASLLVMQDTPFILNESYTAQGWPMLDVEGEEPMRYYLRSVQPFTG